MLKKKKVAPSAEPPSEEAIRAWLISNIASVVNLDPARIDIHQTFDNYGLDSLQAVSLSGDLENWLSREISPTVVWDYPTVEMLAQHLSKDHVNGQPAEPAIEKDAD